MNANDPNVALIEFVAAHLGEDLRNQVVFVGGAVAGLLITDPALPAIRATQDVDLITQVTTLVDYHRTERALTARGFVQDMSPQAPICRWRIGSALVDVMPTLESILGFSNRWYSIAMQTAEWIALPNGTQIQLISAPAFLATKFEAFLNRGGNDYLFSHDLGDIIAVIDGREASVNECALADAPLRAYLRESFSQLLDSRRFLEALPGHLPPDPGSQARTPELIGKLRNLAALG